MRTTCFFVCLVFSLAGCATMDTVVVRWHDGKVIKIEGGAKSLVKVKIKDGEVEVDNRKTSFMTTLLNWATLKAANSVDDRR